MLEFLTRHKTTMPSAADALPGRDTPIVDPGRHAVLDTPMAPPFPDGTEQLVVGMGCFWGAEQSVLDAARRLHDRRGLRRRFTPNPTYEEVCSGRTGHNEVVLWCSTRQVIFDEILKAFWEGHDPTQGMRQGNDMGTQYRSGIYTFDDAQRQRPRPPGRPTAGARGDRPWRGSPRRSRPRASSSTPRSTTSSTWPRTRAGTAAWAARAHVSGGTDAHGLTSSVSGWRVPGSPVPVSLEAGTGDRDASAERSSRPFQRPLVA